MMNSLNRVAILTKNIDRKQMTSGILILPYKGKKGEHTLRNLKRHITKLLQQQEEVALVFTGTN